MQQDKKPAAAPGKTATDNAEYQIVTLEQIAVISNTRKEFDEADIKELSESIKQKGVLQPILLRPLPVPLKDNPKAKYQLVCGERRFRASKLAGKKDIPAGIRNMTDEEVIEIQITENLMRKDISPLDEAAAFKQILDTGKINVEELGKRLGKEKDYINRRLRLNEMFPEFKKLLYSGQILLVHAFEIYKMTLADQQKFYEELKKDEALDLIHTMTAKQLEEEINSRIVQSLKDAPFNPNDANLLAQVGACTACPKRSGNNPSLFGTERGDRCFDKTCYTLKTDAAYESKLAAAIKDPETILIAAWGGNRQDALKTIAKAGHTVYKDHEWMACEKSAPGAKKGFVVAGYENGTTKWVKIREVQKKEPLTAQQKEQKIQQEIESAREADEERLVSSVLEKLNTLPEFNTDAKVKSKNPLKKIETDAMFLILWEGVNYELPGDLQVNSVKDKSKLFDIKPEVKALIIRNAITEWLNDNTYSEEAQMICTALAKAYIPKEYDKLHKEMLETRAQREAKLKAGETPKKK